jgi:hypothetical protein
MEFRSQRRRRKPRYDCMSGSVPLYARAKDDARGEVGRFLPNTGMAHLKHFTGGVID